MITTDNSAIIQRNVEEWTREIKDYVDKYGHNMTARNLFPVRNVGADTAIDVVTNYDRTGETAQIVAKGSIPETAGMKASTTNYDIFQISTAFNINAKDLKLDPKGKARQIDICMRDVHKKEDTTVLNGVSRYGITGLVGAAQANSGGVITAAASSGINTGNAGAWSGETGTDIYDDINTAIGMMDDEFEPAYLVGSRANLLYLNRMDSERQPYYKSISGLFGKKNPDDKSWMWTTNQFTDTDKVYVIPKDFMAAEMVVSENPRLVSYPMSAGENYRFEIVSWSAIEIYENDAFVEIQVT